MSTYSTSELLRTYQYTTASGTTRDFVYLHTTDTSKNQYMNLERYYYFTLKTTSYGSEDYLTFGLRASEEALNYETKNRVNYLDKLMINNSAS